MLLRYALYERKPPHGYQWTWRYEDLKDTLLDDFVYRIRMPDNANTIQPTHLRGGIEKFSQVQGSKLDVHLVFYRFYDGGNDEGRSRVTMLTAWAKADQFPALLTAYGVLELFRNQMFENILKKAWAIGIEQPYSLTSNEQFPATGVAPSAGLAEFLCGLTDQSNDYSLTIHDDNQKVQKKPSAAFKKLEENRLKEEEQRKEKKSWPVVPPLPVNPIPGPGTGNWWRTIIGKPACRNMLIFCTIFAFEVWLLCPVIMVLLWSFYYPDQFLGQFLKNTLFTVSIIALWVIIVLARWFFSLWRPFLSTQVLSPADEVLDRFKKLPSSSQNKVLDKLSIIANGKR